MRSGRDLLAGVGLILVGVYFVALWTHMSGGDGGFDIYQYWLPNMLYGLQRLRAGGSGLLWNPFQNAGQPSFGISSTGLLYPLNALFLVLDPHRTMLVELVANFAIAGAGMYYLCRELGAGRAGALCGALAFELSGATIDLNAWTLLVGDAYVWMPVTLLFCERVLARPSLGNAAGLGGSIAVSLLSGFPQLVFFCYQLIALRVAFEYLSRRPLRPLATLLLLGIGLALGPLLDAVQLLPGAQVAADSVRGHSLDLAEMDAKMSLSVATLRQALLWRADTYEPILLIPFALATASWLYTSTRRRAIFYTIGAILYSSLAFGPDSLLFRWYLHLPFAALFRNPIRFTWVTGFCLSVLSGLGADAILRAPATRRRQFAAAVCVGAAVAGFYGLAPDHVRRLEWVLVAMLAVAIALTGFGANGRRIAAVLLIAVTAANVLSFGSPGLPPALNAVATREFTLRRLLPDESIYAKYAAVFADLRQRLTAQDRVYVLHAHTNYALAPKVASLARLPSIDDYEPQPSLRWAQYMVMLRNGQTMTSLNQCYFPPVDHIAPGFQRRLLDLAAVRYVLVDASVENGIETLTPPLYPIAVAPDLQLEVYENQQALPRAFYVPRALVVPDSGRLLRDLASGRFDPRSVVLIDEPPPSGWLGGDAAGEQGQVAFLVDEPERVVVRVDAPARGFLHLADQYAPEWRATVNGAPAPILRANHAFRAVEVPAGESVVEFRYRPFGVWLGAAMTIVTVAGLAVAAVVVRKRPRDRRVGARSTPAR